MGKAHLTRCRILIAAALAAAGLLAAAVRGQKRLWPIAKLGPKW